MDTTRGFETAVGLAAVLQRLCLREQRWGMLLTFYNAGNGASPEEVRKAAPYLSEEESFRLYAEEPLLLLFATEADCTRCYGQTVGDDGPTGSNSYAGPVRVSALTCTPAGTLANENT